MEERFVANELLVAISNLFRRVTAAKGPMGEWDDAPCFVGAIPMASYEKGMPKATSPDKQVA
ncbi:MAG: hypothetical protein FWG10_12135 [Eubacteriaceae bacterium]|nr:hypothetical protein [Eubacteriaceae bacterium]